MADEERVLARDACWRSDPLQGIPWRVRAVTAADAPRRVVREV